MFHVARRLECVGDDFLKLGDIKRLKEIIIGPQFHGLNGSLGSAVSRHQNDEQFGVRVPNPAKGFQSAHAGHADIHENQVGLEFGNDLQALFSAGGGGELDFGRIKNPLDRITHVFFIINQQQPAHSH